MLRIVIASGLLATAAPAIHLATAPSLAVTAEDCQLPTQTLTRADLPEGTSVVACAAVGRRLKLSNGIGVVVPPPGHGVTATALGVEEEDSLVISVEVTPDGEIHYETPAHALTAATTSTSPGPCEDRTYQLLAHKWYGTLAWRLNDVNKPSSLTATQTLQAIREGAANIANSYNSCGSEDYVSATNSYLGTTTAATDMYTSNGIVYCDSYSQTNKVSVVAFQSMPSSYLGATCTWRINRDPDVDEAVETDLRLNLNKGWTTTPADGDCTSQYDLEYVVTHERGHSFGLADLAGDHAALTMYERGSACSSAGRTLGVGDVLGLRQRY